MSKKKPYSKIANAKLLREIEFDRRRARRELPKKNAPDWFVRLTEEIDDLSEKIVKLQDFLWVKETKDSPALYSPESEKICPKVRKLLVRQNKAMETYLKILVDRSNLGWPKDPENLPCKKRDNADHRKQRGRSEKAKKGGK